MDGDTRTYLLYATALVVTILLLVSVVYLVFAPRPLPQYTEADAQRLQVLAGAKAIAQEETAIRWIRLRFWIGSGLTLGLLGLTALYLYRLTRPVISIVDSAGKTTTIPVIRSTKQERYLVTYANAISANATALQTTQTAQDQRVFEIAKTTALLAKAVKPDTVITQTQPSALALPPSPPALLAHPAPTLLELLTTGVVSADSPLFAGLTTQGEPRPVSFDDLRVAGIGGAQGSGKTWSTIWLLMQLALHLRCRTLFFDPHRALAGSLTHRLAPLTTQGITQEMMTPEHLVGQVQQAVRTRMTSDLPDNARSPLVIVIDELLNVLNTPYKKDMLAILRQAQSEFRKMNIHVLGVSAYWNSTAFGCRKDVRDGLTAQFVHPMRESAAEVFGKRVAALLPTLAPKGQAIFVPMSAAPEVVTIPTITAEAVQYVAEQCDDFATNEAEPPLIQQTASDMLRALTGTHTLQQLHAATFGDALKYDTFRKKIGRASWTADELAQLQQTLPTFFRHPAQP